VCGTIFGNGINPGLQSATWFTVLSGLTLDAEDVPCG
jgi:hypothetical protein